MVLFYIHFLFIPLNNLSVHNKNNKNKGDLKQMRIKNLEEIKENSIIIKKEVDVTYPNGKRKLVNINIDTKKYDRHWSMNNSIIALVFNRIMYVIPYNPTVMKVLKEEGFFFTNDLPVLFSEGDFPTYEKFRWNNLKEKIFNFQAQG